MSSRKFSLEAYFLISEILVAPPAVEILRVDDLKAS